MSNLLTVENLRIAFRTEEGDFREAVRGVSFSLGREKLGIVGESGSGKSLTGRAVLGVLPPYARMSADRIEFDGIDLRRADSKLRRSLRGSRLGMILQDPKFSLNPVMRIGDQIVEAIRIGDRRMSGRDARRKALETLEAVHIREPQRVAKLHANVRHMREGLAKLGFQLHDSPTAIIPIMIGDTAEAIRKSRRLMELGVMVIAFGFPVVPQGAARLRVQISAALDEAHMQRALDAFAKL